MNKQNVMVNILRSVHMVYIYIYMKSAFLCVFNHSSGSRIAKLSSSSLLLSSSSSLFCSLFDLLQSPDGKQLACGSHQGVVVVFDMTTGKLMHKIEGTCV